MSHPLDQFFETGNDINPATIDATWQALLDRWQAAITQGEIGFLPRASHKRMYWYAFAPSARQRRELLGLLDAWVGPTYSDLASGRGELSPADAFDVALATLEVPPLRFEVLPRVSQTTARTEDAAQAKEAVRNALLMVTRLTHARPPSQFDALRTTVEVLDDLGHALAVRDRGLVDACIAELERSADLDETNLAFLRLRCYAGLRDWERVLEEPSLEHVLSMRRPLGVTRVIQSALYHERFQDLDHYGAESDLREAAEHLEPRFRDLYTGARPTTRAEAVIELVCRLLTTESADDSAVVNLIDVASSIQTGLDEQFRRVVTVFVPSAATLDPEFDTPHEEPADPTAKIAALMFQGEFAACIDLALASPPSVEVGRVAVFAARQLSSRDVALRVMSFLTEHALKESIVATSPVLRTHVEWLETVTFESPIRDWKEWFTGLTEPEFETLPLTEETMHSWEPLAAPTLLTLLTEASDTTLAKLGERGGQFLAAHRDVFESEGAAEVTSRLIASMAFSGKASAGIRVQTLALVESLTASSPSPSVYQEALEWTAEIVKVNAAAVTVAWICDLVQTLTSIPTNGSTAEVLSFYFAAVEALRPYRTALDSTDLEALDMVAGELDTELPVGFRAATTAGEEDPAAPYRYLERKTVILHSLTESAVIRAAQVLKRLVPTVDVRTNSDHAGSTQLAQISTNADFFVIVTAAAKHAATTFIAAHRGSQSTILVNSRGSSAILRELRASS